MLVKKQIRTFELFLFNAQYLFIIKKYVRRIKLLLTCNDFPFNEIEADSYGWCASFQLFINEKIMKIRF